ncbi:MAG: CotH kinase family protein, partial [Rubripirellula sp.]
MSKSQSLFGRALSKLGNSQEKSRTRRRRPSRRLSAEALEARQLLAGDLFINEFMADNDSVIEDPDEAGAYEDWVEIYNAGTTAVDLAGKYLTDDVDAPTQWQFPAGSTIAAGGHLLIWADGESEQGDNHASFKLSAGGETIALYDTDGTTQLDVIEFGEQLTDVSYGRVPDGGDTLGSLLTATPGATNATITDTNITPTADAGGPYYGTTADTITLSGSKSEDSDGTIATYAWDLDSDGDYDDATGETVSFLPTTVGTFVVGLQVTDNDGATNVDTGTIKITQVGDVATAWDPVTIDDEAAAFFDDTYVHEVSITFDDDDWYNTLFTSHDTDATDPYFEADFVADGIALENVGVRFKGNSSFDGSGVKKSIKIDFNEFEDLTFMGLKKLNLNNNYNDPTMLREKLFYDYASNFVEGVGRAVFTRVTINGEFYGLYTAVEQVDSTFTESRFGDDEDGNLYKGTASDDAVLSDPSADFGSDLTYLGTDQAAYEAFYDLKTNEAANDYSNLIELIDVLNNTASSELADAIEPLLDVQDTLASLALNNLFVNLDSYSGAAHNYYLYERDDTGQFTHLLWDANESFGTFTQFVDRFQDPVQLDPFFLPVSTGGRPGQPVEEELRPLAENLWDVDDYSIDYLRDLQQMLDEGFDVTTATARINELADLIRADVSADPNKQFTLAQFNSNLTTDVSAGNRTLYGLTSFISDRSTYLASALAQYDLEPESVEVYINEIMADNDATIEDPDEAGAFEDWIELYNPGATSVDLSGLYL